MRYVKVQTPETALQVQRAAYNALLQSLGSASFDQIEAALAERETAEPEEGLTPELVVLLQDKALLREKTRHS